MIVTADKEALLIDTGPSDSGTEALIPLLEEYGITALTLIITHFDADHMGNVDELVEAGFDIHVYDRGTDPLDPSYLDYLYLSLLEGKREALLAGSVLTPRDDLVITTIVSDGSFEDGTKIEIESENEKSLGLLLEYGSFKLFAGGDLTGGGNETVDLETHTADLTGPVDVLIVNHHGSNTSSNEHFLRILDPVVSVLSVGANAYGHPTPEVMNRLSQIGSSVYKTEEGDIDILVHMDGSFEVEGDSYP
ncbi:MBL fold metallo-hydrolase [bacterium]|nr:MBL fold metallo-hydrolase [bacterium]